MLNFHISSSSYRHGKGTMLNGMQNREGQNRRSFSKVSVQSGRRLDAIFATRPTCAENTTEVDYERKQWVGIATRPYGPSSGDPRRTIIDPDARLVNKLGHKLAIQRSTCSVVAGLCLESIGETVYFDYLYFVMMLDEFV
jgi:hypothetical protein